MDCSNIRSSRGGQHHGAAAKRLVGQRLGVDVMSRHLVCSTLVVATLILAVCSSACVQTQDEHRPAAQALADLRASAEAGDAEAQFILGGIHVTGVGVPPDVAEAVGWYRRAAEQGHLVCSTLVVATLILAVCSSACVQTQDEHRPAAQALADLRASAEAGDAEAQFILGGIHVTGVGVPQDAAEAVAWYRCAAEQGDASAQSNLGGMYDQGLGVSQDAAGAVAWYRRAAEQGHVRAQYNLGGMYAEGRAVPADAVEAHMWLTIAASRSTGAEREQIVTARAAVAVRMTPTDLREAEGRAQAWHAAHQGMRNRAVPRRPATRHAKA